MMILFIAFVVAAILLFWTNTKVAGPKVPIALLSEYNSKKRRIQYFTFSSKNALVKAYTSARNHVFGLETSEGTTCVIPVDYLDALKSHKSLSFEATLNDLTLSRYTFVGGLPDFGVKIMIGKFNPTLDTYTPIIHDMVRQKWPEAFDPQGEFWTETSVYLHMLQLVATISARVLHSADASENETWVKLSTDYVQYVIPYVQGLKAWPKFLRPLVWRSIPGYQCMKEHREKARDIIKQTLRDKQTGDGWSMESPPSMLDYLATGRPPILDSDHHFSLQITMVVAAVHTTAATLTQSLFDMAVQSKFLPELREEIREVSAHYGETFTRESLSRLWKLDSFVKEVQRFNSPDLTTFQRKALTPLKLPNGLDIPAGSKIELATAALNLDPEIWNDADSFQPLRFYNMRLAAKENESKHQFVSVSKRELSWGYGRHACPGRWLSDIEIKIILAEFLMRCDIKNPDGQGRWESSAIDGQIMPNENGKVLVRKFTV